MLQSVVLLCVAQSSQDYILLVNRTLATQNHRQHCAVTDTYDV